MSFAEDARKLRKERIARQTRPMQASQPGTKQIIPAEKSTFFQKGALKDGDVLGALVDSTKDVRSDLMAGVLGIGEKAVDAGAYLAGGIGKLFGAEDFAEKTKDFISKDLYDEKAVADKILGVTSGLPDLVKTLRGEQLEYEEGSVFGDKTDALAQSGGQMLGTAALQMVGVPWQVTSGVTSFGSETENAFKQGATYGQAGLSGLISAGAEILTEKLFGGSGLGEKGLIDMDLLTKGISNKLAHALTKFGLDMTTEGMEEVFSAFASNLGSALYREENLLDILWSEDAVDNYIDSFVSGMAMGGIANLPQTAGDVKAALSEKSKNTATQQPQRKPSLVDDIVNRITANRKNTATEASQSAEKTSQDYVDSLLDEVTAKATGAPADPVGAAVEAFKATGTVTNKQATDILNSVKAVTQIINETGIELPHTASGRRAVIKQAIADLAQKQAQPPVDTEVKTDYDNKNTQGGTVYADTYTQGKPDYSGGVRRNPQGNSQREAAPGAGNGSVYAGNGPQSRNLREENRGAVYSADSEGRALTQDQTAQFQEIAEQAPKYKASKINQAILRLVERVKGGLSTGTEKVQLNPVSDNIAAQIRALTGIDVRGYKVAVEARQIDHILKDHGENGRSDHSMADASDIAKMEYALEDPDSIVRSGTTRAYVTNKNGKMKPADTVLYEKQNGDGSYYVVQAVPDTNKKTLYIVTAFIGKSGYKNTEAPQSANANSPGATPEAESAVASNNIVHQTSPEVNPNRTPSPDESVGAAPSGFDPISHLQYEYGTLPEGENPVRPDDLPKSTDGKDRVSHTARTAKGAKVTPDEFVDLLDKDVAEGGLSYIPITNNATTQKAMDHIAAVGWEAAKATWSANVHAGKTGADMSAVGALLLNNAAKAGDKAAWRKILHDYQRMGTNTAQGLQALRILKKLEPTDSLYMIERSVKQMVEDMQVDVTLDEDLLHEFENAETDEARDEALDKIQQSVANQIPSTFMEKWTALRYVNMLGNLRTQVRNVAGNAGMKAVSSVKNAIAALIENAAHSVSGGKIEKTKSLTVNKTQLEAGKADFDRFKSMVLGGKYADSQTASGEFAQGVQDKRTIFKFKPLEGYRKVTNWAMEKGDVIFSRDAYARALAGYLKAHGVTQTDYSKVDTALMDNARLYAAQEAQEQTFRDTNWLSGWVSKIGRRKDTPVAGRILSEGIMPFRKTPANVLIRAEEYSPLGIINSVYYSIKAAQNGSDVTASQVINSWAKTLTGTGIFALGMLLSNLGILSGGPDEDENKEDFESLNGWQNYALNLPDGTNITIDWLTPAAMPLLMGAQLMEFVQDGGFQLKDLEKALLSIADPMVEMSMLQGISDTLENVRYADSNFGQFAANAALSYLAQGLTNTLLGQIERTFEDSRMTTYVDKDSALPDWLQRFIGKASAKTPGLDYNQIPYINAWGEEEENPPTLLNGLYNTLSPGYIEKGASDALTQELNRLAGAQSDKNVYPSVPDKTITIDGKKRNLSSEEYVALAKAQGKTAKGLAEDIIASEYYDSLSDQQKAAAISYAYEYAREHARVKTLEDYTEYSAKWMEGLDGNAAEAILRKVAVGSVEKYTDIPIDSAAYISDLLDSILPETGYSSTRYVQRVEAITGSDLTEEQQKQIMDEVLDDAAYAKYLRILDEGYSNDDYATALRIYLDSEKTNTRTKKEVIIREFMDDLDLTRKEAEALYKLYSGK